MQRCWSREREREKENGNCNEKSLEFLTVDYEGDVDEVWDESKKGF